jgi:hypothetical protein
MFLASLGLSGVAVACTDNVTGPTNQPNAVSPARVTGVNAFAGQVAVNRGIEHEILRLESAIPGIGGMYVDGSDIVVYAPKNMSRGQVISALAREAHGMGITADIKAQLARGANIRVRTANFSLSQLVAWQDNLGRTLSHVEGLTGIDADESTNQVRINVDNEASIANVQSLVAAAGIPSNAFTVKVAPRAIAASGLRGTWRPTGGGVTISNPNAVCSLGFNATTNTGLNVLVTAGHCAGGTPGLGATGATEGQPNTSFPVGTIQNNPAWTRTDAGCSGYTRCTLADALLVQYSIASTMSKRVAFTSFTGLNGGGGSITVTGWWDNVVAPTASLFVGQSVDKEGQTTGWTRGTISQTCVNTPVSDGTGVYMVLCAEAVTGSRIGQGDSGGPFFIPPTPGNIHNPLYPIGVVFAGGPFNAYDPSINAYYCTLNCTLYASHWSNIEAHLGVSVFPN